MMNRAWKIASYIVFGIGVAFPVTTMFIVLPVLIAALLGNRQWMWSINDAEILLVGGLLVGGAVGAVIASRRPEADDLQNFTG